MDTFDFTVPKLYTQLFPKVLLYCAMCLSAIMLCSRAAFVNCRVVQCRVPRVFRCLKKMSNKSFTAAISIQGPLLWHVKRCNIRSYSFAFDNFSFACDNFSFALDNFNLHGIFFHLYWIIFICMR